MSNKYTYPFASSKPSMEVVNTSLPAKEAPKLAPGTLASLTAPSGTPLPTTSYSSMYRIPPSKYVKPAAAIKVESTEDFPSLGSTIKKPIAVTAKASFADLARDWAKKKQEEEEKKKLDDALEADKKRLQYESDARLTREVHKGIHKLLIGKKRDIQEEEDQTNIPPPDDYDYDNYEVAGEEEEEEDIEYDPTTNYKRNKNELSTF